MNAAFVAALPRARAHASPPCISPARRGAARVCMRLRGGARAYNAALRRGGAPRGGTQPDEAERGDTGTRDEPAALNGLNGAHVHLEVSDGPAAPAPPGDNGAHGNGRGDEAEGEGEGEGEGEDEDAEIAALLRAAGRELPRDATHATREQIARMLAVEGYPVVGGVARRWPALRNRLMANERLPVQLAVELTVGLVTKTAAEVQDRGARFWREVDLYVSDLSLELVGDAMLVWLLSPAARMGGGGGFWAGLPRHAGQVGAFGLGARAAGFAVKAAQFGAVGVASSAVGHGLTRWLVSLRGAGAGDARAALPPVAATSACWGGFMMASSNTRYQAVNALEQRVLERYAPGGAAGAALTFCVRFANCYVGGVQWLPWARFWGVQQRAD